MEIFFAYMVTTSSMPQILIRALHLQYMPIQPLAPATPTTCYWIVVFQETKKQKRNGNFIRLPHATP